jgi:hypothetical protein
MPSEVSVAVAVSTAAGDVAGEGTTSTRGRRYTGLNGCATRMRDGSRAPS